MKKLLIVAVVASFGMVSCKKDYTCTCTIDGDTSSAGTFKDAKKKDADDACESLETQAKMYDAAASCSI